MKRQTAFSPSERGQALAEYIVLTSAIALLFYLLFYSSLPLINSNSEEKTFRDLMEGHFKNVYENTLSSVPDLLDLSFLW